MWPEKEYCKEELRVFVLRCSASLRSSNPSLSSCSRLQSEHEQRVAQGLRAELHPPAEQLRQHGQQQHERLRQRRHAEPRRGHVTQLPQRLVRQLALRQ